MSKRKSKKTKAEVLEVEENTEKKPAEETKKTALEETPVEVEAETDVVEAETEYIVATSLVLKCNNTRSV